MGISFANQSWMGLGGCTSEFLDSQPGSADTLLVLCNFIPTYLYCKKELKTCRNILPLLILYEDNTVQYIESSQKFADNFIQSKYVLILH